MVESINVIWVLLGSSKVGIRHNIELVTKRGMQEDCQKYGGHVLAAWK